MIRNGPKTRVSKPKPGERSSISRPCRGAGDDAAAVARVEDPDAASERLVLARQHLEREFGVGSGHDHPPHVGSVLAGAEEQRVVPEVDVVRPAGRGQPGNGGLARLTPLERLARVQRRGSRPSPGDLGREQGGNGERQHAPGRAVRPDPQAAGGR